MCLVAFETAIMGVGSRFCRVDSLDDLFVDFVAGVEKQRAR